MNRLTPSTLGDGSPYSVGVPTLRTLVPAALVAVLTISGCSAVDTNNSSRETNQQNAPETSSNMFDAVAAIDHITSCDDVATLVEPHIDGLVLDPESSVDEDGVFCDWGPPEGNTDFSMIRAVGVSIEPTGDNVVPAASDLQKAGLTIHPDPAIDRIGGIAYSMEQETSVAAVNVTLVRVPGLDIDIAGGQWEGYPSLDAAASIALAKNLLRL